MPSEENEGFRSNGSMQLLSTRKLTFHSPNFDISIRCLIGPFHRQANMLRKVKSKKVPGCANHLPDRGGFHGELWILVEPLSLGRRAGKAAGIEGPPYLI